MSGYGSPWTRQNSDGRRSFSPTVQRWPSSEICGPWWELSFFVKTRQVNFRWSMDGQGMHVCVDGVQQNDGGLWP